jgi:type II secretory pathway pseudopilin PulG
LIELLIVVAIILIIAAIAIPNFMKSKMAANETAAVGSIRVIGTGAVSYYSTYRNGYPPSLGALGPPSSGTANCDNADLVDSLLAGGVGGTAMTSVKGGYRFTYAASAAVTAAGTGCTTPGSEQFQLNGDPTSPGNTGQRYFFMNESGVIRFNTTQQAGPGDTPIPAGG